MWEAWLSLFLMVICTGRSGKVYWDLFFFFFFFFLFFDVWVGSKAVLKGGLIFLIRWVGLSSETLCLGLKITMCQVV